MLINLVWRSIYCFALVSTLLPHRLTLQYFCVDKSQSASYKTLKVYLAAICLMHIENGLPDPTTNQSLHLMCRGIRWQQSSSERTRLPITIILLRTLEYQLCSSHMSLLEQWLLWTAFTLSSPHASECLNLTWSDIIIHKDHITITLRQSKDRPLSERTIDSHICHYYNNAQYELCVTTMTCLPQSNHTTLYSLLAQLHPCSVLNSPQYCVSSYLKQACTHPSMHHTALELGQQP